MIFPGAFAMLLSYSESGSVQDYYTPRVENDWRATKLDVEFPGVSLNISTPMPTTLLLELVKKLEKQLYRKFHNWFHFRGGEMGPFSTKVLPIFI